jgi:polysaccharide pyruvyl transferase WcaK-like protein
MKKVFFVNHIDSGNRGCEAITKSLIELFGNDMKYVIFSENYNLDVSLGFSYISKIINYNKISIMRKFFIRILRFFKINSEFLYIFSHLKYLRMVKKGDIVLSTGGDLFCYGENEVPTVINYFHKKKIRTILWGATICEDKITERKFKSLKMFHQIILRESRSFTLLKELGFENIYLLPDSAFYLKSTFINYPIETHSIGINLSPHIIKSSIDFEKYVILIQKIIDNTDFHIYLLPHVFWSFDDDNKVISSFKERFKTDRISYVDTSKITYQEIRFLISKLYVFIGARTHSIISSYCTFTPSLAISYSEKSISIHNDLKLPKEMIVFKNEDVESIFLKFTYIHNNRVYLSKLIENQLIIYRKNKKQLFNQILSIP